MRSRTLLAALLAVAAAAVGLAPAARAGLAYATGPHHRALSAGQDPTCSPPLCRAIPARLGAPFVIENRPGGGGQYRHGGGRARGAGRPHPALGHQRHPRGKRVPVHLARLRPCRRFRADRGRPAARHGGQREASSGGAPTRTHLGGRAQAGRRLRRRPEHDRTRGARDVRRAGGPSWRRSPIPAAASRSPRTARRREGRGRHARRLARADPRRADQAARDLPRKRGRRCRALPTFREPAWTGGSAWNAFYAPRGTPREIVRALNSVSNAGLADPELRAAVVDGGAEPMGGTPEDLVRLMLADRTKWEPVIRNLGITVQ